MLLKVPAENQRRAAGPGRVGELLDNLQQQSGGSIGVFLMKRANRIAKTVRLNRADRGTAAGFVRRDGREEPGNKHYPAYRLYQSALCLFHPPAFSPAHPGSAKTDPLPLAALP